VAAVPAAVTATLPTARDIAVDVRVLAFTGAISILTSILFAVIPLFGFDRRGPGSTLQEEASRTTPGLRWHRMQSGLVVSTVTLLAFSVAERRREIALRVALGAEPQAILRMVVGHGLKLVALGLTAGGLASFGVRVLTSFLYQTDTHDVVTFAVVPVVLVLISLVACALPAMRALQVEPITALRSE
jgi:spore maturation protein SpmB